MVNRITSNDNEVNDSSLLKQKILIKFNSIPFLLYPFFLVIESFILLLNLSVPILGFIVAIYFIFIIPLYPVWIYPGVNNSRVLPKKSPSEKTNTVNKKNSLSVRYTRLFFSNLSIFILLGFLLSKFGIKLTPILSLLVSNLLFIITLFISLLKMRKYITITQKNRNILKNLMKFIKGFFFVYVDYDAIPDQADKMNNKQSSSDLYNDHDNQNPIKSSSLITDLPKFPKNYMLFLISLVLIGLFLVLRFPVLFGDDPWFHSTNTESIVRSGFVLIKGSYSTLTGLYILAAQFCYLSNLPVLTVARYFPIITIFIAGVLGYNLTRVFFKSEQMSILGGFLFIITPLDSGLAFGQFWPTAIALNLMLYLYLEFFLLYDIVKSYRKTYNSGFSDNSHPPNDFSSEKSNPSWDKKYQTDLFPDFIGILKKLINKKGNDKSGQLISNSNEESINYSGEALKSNIEILLIIISTVLDSIACYLTHDSTFLFISLGLIVCAMVLYLRDYRNIWLLIYSLLLVIIPLTFSFIFNGKLFSPNLMKALPISPIIMILGLGAILFGLLILKKINLLNKLLLPEEKVFRKSRNPRLFQKNMGIIIISIGIIVSFYLYFALQKTFSNNLTHPLSMAINSFFIYIIAVFSIGGMLTIRRLNKNTDIFFFLMSYFLLLLAGFVILNFIFGFFPFWVRITIIGGGIMSLGFIAYILLLEIKNLLNNQKVKKIIIALFILLTLNFGIYNSTNYWYETDGEISSVNIIASFTPNNESINYNNEDLTNNSAIITNFRWSYIFRYYTQNSLRDTSKNEYNFYRVLFLDELLSLEGNQSAFRDFVADVNSENIYLLLENKQQLIGVTGPDDVGYGVIKSEELSSCYSISNLNKVFSYHNQQNLESGSRKYIWLFEFRI